jgi:phage terminase large subunit
MSAKEIQFPSKARGVFEPHRFKSLRGGRDGSKSWIAARALLEMGATQPEFIVCARENMNSIADSCHRLLVQQIGLLDMQDQWEIEKARIMHRKTGTEFVFKGLRHNPDAIKSLEGATKLWVEEAQSVSKDSWDKAIPTIRRPGSEIWLTWNPQLETDDTWRRFVINPPPDCLDIVINFSDNPWASEVLRAEREKLAIDDPDEYAHIWLGQPRRAVVGGIYSAELRKADTEGRITRVPYDTTKPVHTAWDLGWGDLVSIWMFQSAPFEWRFIDYMEGNNQEISTFVRDLQQKPYVWGTDYLPWDAASTGRLATGKSVEAVMRGLGRNVQVVPQNLVSVGIDAGRRMFQLSWFDIEKCADGIQALRHYRYGEIKALSTSDHKTPTREPLHDWASHPADAYRTAAMGVETPTSGKPKPSAPPTNVYYGPSGWMA